MRVTLKDIAAKIGIDPSVVSVVLNSRPSRIGVSEVRRKQILDVAKMLGYRPNLAARQLKGGKSKVIGVVMRSSHHDGPGELRRCLSEFLYEKGYQIFLATLMDDASNMDLVTEELLSRNIDGLIHLSAPFRPEAQKYPVPSVIVYDNEVFGDLGFDLAYGMRLATEHLISHGHRKIAYINNIDRPLKLSGWRDAMRANGVRNPDRWIIQSGMNVRFREELDHLLRKEKITACVCCNDYFAARLIVYLKRHGYAVPDDVAVIGYDGSGFATCVNPSLTTVVLPNRLLAKECVDLMMKRLGEDPAGGRALKQKTRQIRPYLHIGGSCGCPDPSPDLLYWSSQSTTLESLDSLESDMPESFRAFNPEFNK